MAMPGFIFGGNTGIKSPEQLRRMRAVAEALAARDNGTPKNVGEGLAAIGDAIRYRRMMNRLEEGETEAQQKNDEAFSPIAAALGMGGSAAATTATGSSKVANALFGKPEAANEMDATNPSGGPQSYRDAIASIESAGSGDYAAIGPTNEKMGRPLGRYQIMEANIGPWSKEALGREVSADEFLANPELQDRVFDHKFQGYVAQYGPEGAAQAWLGGPGSVGKTDRRDVLGTSVGEYGNRFMSALGPQEVASLDPRAGMQQPQTAAQAIEQQAPVGGSLSDEVADWRQTPEAAAQFPGRQAVAEALQARGSNVAGAPPSPAVAAVGQAVMGQQGQMPPLPAPQTVGPAPSIAGPQPQPQAAPQQVAQAAPAQQSGPTLAQLYTALQSPWLDDGRRALVISEIQRQQKLNDPSAQLDMQYRRAQIDALSQKPQKNWQRLDDNTLFDAETGETRNVPIDPNAPAGGGDLGLNPQYGTDAQGNPVLLQLGKNGQVVQSKMPAGVTLSKEPIRLDAGTHFVIMDPITRQPIATIPKDVAGEASATVQGKASGEAQANLGQMEDTGAQVLSTIDSLANDPYLDSMVGSVQGRMPNFTSDAARVQGKMDQIQGQQFLQAFNSLRGGGQITEVEGKKATDAIAALNTAQNETDYRAALATFRGIVETGMARARHKAGAGPASAPQGGLGTPQASTAPAAADPLSAARAAIARGAPRDAVMQRLRQSGINPEGL